MRLNFMSMLIVGLVILSVVVVSDKRMMSFVTKMSKKVTLGSKKMNQAAVLFLVFLLLLCMMKGKKTVEGLCGCRIGQNLDVTIQAGSDWNCPHTGTGNSVVFDDETASEACDCSEGQCEVGHTAESLRDEITGVPQADRRGYVELSSGMGVEAYLRDVIGLAGSRLSEMMTLINGDGSEKEEEALCGCTITNPSSGAVATLPGGSPYVCHEDSETFTGPDALCNCDEDNVDCSYGYVSRPEAIYNSEVSGAQKPDERRQLLSAMTNGRPEEFVARILTQRDDSTTREFISYFGLDESAVEAAKECTDTCTGFPRITDSSLCDEPPNPFHVGIFNALCPDIHCSNTAVCQ